MKLLDRAAELVRWAWNPPETPEDELIDHPFFPVSWTNRCGAIPGHGDDHWHCPTPGHCQHNSCMEPRRYHREAAGD